MEMLSLKGRLAKLLDVKSLVTFLMSAVFAALALRGDISGQEFQTVFTVVIGFYFGTQAQKQPPPSRFPFFRAPGAWSHRNPPAAPAEMPGRALRQGGGEPPGPVRKGDKLPRRGLIHRERLSGKRRPEPSGQHNSPQHDLSFCG